MIAPTTSIIPTRRQFIAAGAALPLVASGWSRALAAPLVGNELPLVTGGLEHLGMVVPDVTKSATFYCGLFGHGLFREAEPPLRYYVMIGKAYIALGSRPGVNEPKLDHYCVTVEGYDREKMDATITEAGYRALGRGVALDPDGIGLQLIEYPAGLVDTNVPADRILGRGYGLMSPYGMDHVVLKVSDLETALPFYDMFFVRTAEAVAGEVWFRADDTTIRVAQQEAGKPPAFDSWAVSVGPYDSGLVAEGVERLGGTVLSSSGDGALHLLDPDGLKLTIVRA